MAEVEFVSELLIAMSAGIREGSKKVIDNYYRQWDDEFPSRAMMEKRFRDIMDIIGGILENQIARTEPSRDKAFLPHVLRSLPSQIRLAKIDSLEGIVQI